MKELVADLFSPRSTQLPDIPVARERVDDMFGLWERRRRALPDPLIDDHVWHRAHAAAVSMAGEGDVLPHGDLHPGNVLHTDGGRRSVAIDPRPCIGDPAMDLTDLVMVGARSEAEIRDRCSEFAAAVEVVEATRLWRWCGIFAPLAAVSLTHRSHSLGQLGLLRELSGAL